MRLYTFVNYYLSSIQQGVQTAHVVSELSLKGGDMYREWAANHKTIIILNGGNNAELVDLRGFISGVTTYPNAAFYEDGQSLGGMMTAHGIILPELVYNEMAEYRKSRDKELWASQTILGDADKQLVERIASYGLAK